jgi:8-amino-7-oxononanoate synthase
MSLTTNAKLALLTRLSRKAPAAPEATASNIDRDRAIGWKDLPNGGELALVHDAGIALGLDNPYFRTHDGMADAETTIGNRRYINFASYNYIGLNGDARVADAAKAAIDHYGVSASASRVVSGERPIHGELEAAIAELYNTEAAIAMVSGHATNVTVIGTLLGKNDLVLHDAAIHNSAVEGAKLSGARRIAFAHNDLGAAERELVAHRGRAGRALLVIEGHYSMDGDLPDLAGFIALARRHKAWLMVDEAHSLGVLGATGRGIAEHQGVDPAGVDIWMGTLSKTLSACGGYIAGQERLISYLKYSAPGFVYSVGMPPVLAAAALASIQVMLAEPERVARLQSNASLFLRLARAAGFDTADSGGMAIVPVILGSSIVAARLAQAMFDAGVNVQPILYPAVPERSARLRFFMSSTHTEAQIRQTVEIMADAVVRVRKMKLLGK